MSNYAKVLIQGELEVKTGMHIGTGAGFAAIGATDSPVVRDPLTKRPVIPGSSLKGKVRTLLSRQLGADSGVIAKKSDNDDARIRRVFGDTKEYMTARLVFRDTILSQEEWERLSGLGAKTATEVKFENTIDRVSSVANPRQIERVIAGSRFEFALIYEVAADPETSEVPSAEEIKEDFQTIVTGLRLLELDYLGGHGTRGYGRVQFHDLTARVPVGKLDGTLLRDLNDGLKGLSDARQAV